MIFDYVAVAQDTANKIVSESFYRDVYACTTSLSLYVCAYIFLFFIY